MASPAALATPDSTEEGRRPVWKTVLILGFLFVVTAVVFGNKDKGSAGNPTRPRGPTSGTATTQPHSVACTTESALDRLVEFSVAGDNDAFARYVLDMRNGCVQMKENLSVYVEDATLGKRKIRMPGSTTSAWTFAEAIR